MEDSKFKEIFFNRADIKKAEEVACDKCFEHMVFMLRDSQQHEFSIGITTVNVLDNLQSVCKERIMRHIPKR